MSSIRLLHKLAVAVALLITVGVLARFGVGRLALPVVGLTVTAALVMFLATRSAYPRTTAGSWTRIIESAAQSADAACIEYKSSTTARRRYVREWVVLGIPVVPLDDGENPVYDAHRD